METQLLRTYLAILVAAIWGIVVIVSLFTQQYTVLGAITPVMLVVAGWLFVKRNGDT